MADIEKVYNGRDNTIDLLLKADGSAVDLSPVTRMKIIDKEGSFEIDSSVALTAIDWATGVTGKVILALGDQNLVVGAYTCYLIVYDPSHDDGLNWGEFTIQVIDEPTVV